MDVRKYGVQEELTWTKSKSLVGVNVGMLPPNKIALLVMLSPMVSDRIFFNTCWELDGNCGHFNLDMLDITLDSEGLMISRKML